MTTSVQDRDQAAEPGLRRVARTGYRWLHALDGLLIAVSAGVQYALVRRR